MKETILFVVLVAVICHAAYAVILARTGILVKKSTTVLGIYFIGAWLSSVIATVATFAICYFIDGHFDPLNFFAVLPTLLISYAASPIVGVPLLLLENRRKKKQN